MPNCIHIETPDTTIAAVLALYDVRDKVVYEPGCGTARFLQVANRRGASAVFGSESNLELIGVARRRLPFSGPKLAMHDMLEFVPSLHIDLLYCYLMHGLTEKVIKHLVAHDQHNFTVISHNYPIYMGNPMITRGPAKTIWHGLDKYPPYSLLYKYKVCNGVVQ